MFISQALGNLYIESKNLFSSDAATFVYVNIFVRSFSKIDDVKMVSGSDSLQHLHISEQPPSKIRKKMVCFCCSVIVHQDISVRWFSKIDDVRQSHRSAPSK